MRIERDFDTRGLSAMNVGGVCDTYIEIEREEQLGHVWSIIGNRDYFVVGGGSNTVFGDVYNGVILKLKGEFCNMRATGTGLICGGGASLGKVCRFAMENSLSGLEKFCGIPGSVGGGVKGNCGAFLGQISDVVQWVEVQNGKKVIRVNNSLCGFSYRNSNLPRGIITAVCFNLQKGDKTEIENLQNQYIKRRKSSHPCEKSCGSTFKRAMGTCVSEMIDKAGLKGYRVGGLEVSTVHAGFVVNIGSGTPSDFLKITADIQRVVYGKYKVEIEREVLFVGKRSGAKLR
ncbi:MAG: UDP-N-acetylmuramate dehydrogenase [Bacillota bacterium]